MPLKEAVAVVLVDASALTRSSSEAHDGGQHVPHTRGLTLAQIPNLPPGRGGRQLSAQEQVHQHAGCVSAILILYALPRLLTGATLAHEIMHAWLRQSGVNNLELEVEEGMCQLMALLWLQRQPQDKLTGSEPALLRFY